MSGAYSYRQQQRLELELMREQQRAYAYAMAEKARQEQLRKELEPVDGGELKAEPVDVIALPSPAKG